VAHLGIGVTTIVPGFIRTDIARNALTGTGAPTGAADEDIDGGMDVDECAAAILEGFASGTEEIAVGKGAEMDLLALKRNDPTGTFRLLEAMATDVVAKRQS
jgi:short-subunit dehydrogenase